MVGRPAKGISAVGNKDADAVWAGSRGAMTKIVLVEVQLAREGLHPRRGQVVGPQNHRQRVAGEGRVGEHIQRVKSIIAAP